VEINALFTRKNVRIMGFEVFMRQDAEEKSTK
jgi:hypothetical protein